MTTMLRNKRLTAARRARRFAFVALFIFLAALSTFAQRRERLVDSWKPLHYDVDLTFDDQLTQITARTEIHGSILKDKINSIDLDFGPMEIDSVTADGHQAMFRWEPREMLFIELGRAAHVG